MNDPVVENAKAVFPNLVIQLEDERQRMITSRHIGNYNVSLLQAPAASVELIGRRAVSAGLGNWFKLIWQIAGRTEYEGTSRSFELGPGQLLVTSMADDYLLNMQDGHEAIILAFNPNEDPAWSDLLREALAKPLSGRSGVVASAEGVRTLLSAPADCTAELTARAMITLALMSTMRADHDGFASPLMSRAALCVQRNLFDFHYGPAQLARDLGMSRRSLYTRMAKSGMTPAGLIGRLRLEQAKDDILNDPGRSLLDIALANGFRDAARFSRAFRGAYGHPPSKLRSEH